MGAKLNHHASIFNVFNFAAAEDDGWGREKAAAEAAEFKKQIKKIKSPCKWWAIIVKQKKNTRQPIKKTKNKWNNKYIFIFPSNAEGYWTLL